MAPLDWLDDMLDAYDIKREMEKVDPSVIEIEAPHIIEIIAEKFDYHSISLMSRCSLIFGGAIRDAIAGLPILGDLDIAIPSSEYGHVKKAFSTSVKWVRDDSRSITQPMGKGMVTVSIEGDEEMEEDIDMPAEDRPAIPRTGRTYGGRPRNSYVPAVEKKLYNKEAVPMSGMCVYKTLDDVKAHLICSKLSHRISGPLASAIHLVKNVDMVCCGMAMDKEGRVFEIVKGAAEDCKNRVLRLNKDTSNIHIQRIIERIGRLVERGWKNEVDIKQAKSILKEIEKNKKKALDNALKKKADNKKNIILPKSEYDRVYMEEIPRKDRNAIVAKHGALPRKELVNIWFQEFSRGKLVYKQVVSGLTIARGKVEEMKILDEKAIAETLKTDMTKELRESVEKVAKDVVGTMETTTGRTSGGSKRKKKKNEEKKGPWTHFITVDESQFMEMDSEPEHIDEEEEEGFY
jgi:hypothetical protein